MKEAKILEIKNLNVWYKKDKPVLKNYNIEINQNEVIGLIGLNGAGKTTFMKTIGGIINNYSLDSLKHNGIDIDFRCEKFKRMRYIVFAEQHSFQYFTFREYIYYVGKAYGKELTDLQELINGFNFEEYTDVLLKELSTGNLKKAYLITAFSLKAELLFLDEPVNGLDFKSTEYLYQLMKNYSKYGTLVFSSHILESICLSAMRVWVLEQGKISKEFVGKEVNAENIRGILGSEEYN